VRLQKLVEIDEMHPLQYISGSQPYHFHSIDGAKGTQSALAHWFHTIPPERMGLNGEYDHDGLAKRVAIALKEHVAAHVMNAISVSQRGAVVVLRVKSPNTEIVQTLVDVAMQVEGASGVEVNGSTYFSSWDLQRTTGRHLRLLAY
jgi:hypothetical protein